MGQIVFTSRFYFQLIDSESEKESILSARFWSVSLIGSLMIFGYAVLRYDPVLFMGQLMGLIVYTRNLMILKKNSKR